MSAVIWSSDVRMLAKVIPATLATRFAPAMLRPEIEMGKELLRTPELGAKLVTLAVAATPVSRVIRRMLPTAS